MKTNKTNWLGNVLCLSISLVIGFLVWSFVSNQNGAYKTYYVQSGSMEPSIRVGDVIIVNTSSSYQLNDVITFNSDINKLVTHRIVEKKNDKGVILYFTKGDANRAGDRETVQHQKIIGKVVLVIPKLGYFVNYLKTPIGYILAVILPSVWIVVSEIAKLNKKKN